MTKEEMELGLSQGRILIQEEWASKQEIIYVDELVSEGKAIVTPWRYRNNFQCKMRYVRGKNENHPHP
jgi:hypothetical protein